MKKEDRETFIDELMMPVGRELAKLKLKFEIKGRPKHIYSIYRKMQRQQKPFEEIYDLFAIRIILDEPHTKKIVGGYIQLLQIPIHQFQSDLEILYQFQK